MWLRWWHPHALNHLEGVVQQGLQGPHELSPACLFHVLCFSSPHTTFSLWQRYGQSHFLKKLVVCKCALFPPNSDCLPLLPKLFPWTWQKLRRLPHSAQWGSPSQHIGNKMICLWRPWQIMVRGGRASPLLTSSLFNTEQRNSVSFLSATLGAKPTVRLHLHLTDFHS